MSTWEEGSAGTVRVANPESHSDAQRSPDLTFRFGQVAHLLNNFIGQGMLLFVVGRNSTATGEHELYN